MKLFGGGKKTRRDVVKEESGEARPFESFIPALGDKVETVVIRPNGKKKSGGKKLLTVFGTAAALVLLLVIGYTIWEKAPDTDGSGPLIHGQKDDTEGEAPVLNLPLTDIDPSKDKDASDESGADDKPQELENVRNTDCYTFIIAAFDQIGASTDTLLVGRLDTREGTLNVVSIPRDTLVNVSWGVKKVNTVMVYEDNDPERFLNKLGGILGFNVDCYAFVDIRAVEKLVDAIGGIDYNVTRNMDYDDPTQDLHIHIPAGYQHLNGQQAVQVLRYRVGNNGTGYPNGDLGRINTQQDLIRSVASQMLSLGNIPNMGKVLDVFEEYVNTNLSANNIAFFIHEFLKLEPEDIHFDMVPGEGISIRSGSYYEIEPIAWCEMINQYLNPFTLEIGLHNLDILSYDSATGAVTSTTGEMVPYDSFYDFTTYKG